MSGTDNENDTASAGQSFNPALRDLIRFLARIAVDKSFDGFSKEGGPLGFNHGDTHD